MIQPVQAHTGFVHNFEVKLESDCKFAESCDKSVCFLAHMRPISIGYPSTLHSLHSHLHHHISQYNTSTSPLFQLKKALWRSGLTR